MAPVALRPIRPMRQIGGASGPSPPPISMPCPASIRARTSFPSTPAGTRTAVSGASSRPGGEQLQPALASAARSVAAAAAWRAQRGSSPSSSTRRSASCSA